jgi:putative phage-type endonuclease
VTAETVETPVCTHLTGVATPPQAPGSADWLQTMSASKVAAALGLSPYDSPFSLWHKMAGNVEAESQDPQLLRGHYLEQGVVDWFAAQHPDWTIDAGGSWRHPEHPRYTAQPDRLIRLYGGEIRGLEAKTAADTDEWGEPGTDQIPIGYRAQVMWQMDVLGTRITHVAVLSAYLQFNEYVVHYDADEAAYIRERAQAFLDTLPGAPGEAQPSIDGHTATYDAIRALHPLINGSDVELDHETARRYCTARHALKNAETEARHAAALVAEALGLGKRARYLGKTIADRRVKTHDGAIPYLQAGNSLPTFDDPDPQEQ